MEAQEHKVWLITGTSKGFGRIWAEAALSRGDRVVATARDPKSLEGLKGRFGDALLPLALDVTDRQASLDAVSQAVKAFGRIDVLVSNAGYGHFGYVEELGEDEVRQQLETNVLGSLWVIQAVLPVMRRQGSGHILQLSSIGGVVAFPGLGLYHASKWAVEGLCDSLAQEVAGFGIRVTLVEPAGYATDWGGPSAKHSAPMDAYQPAREAMRARGSGIALGKPEATAEAILALVDSAEPPLRAFLGTMTLPLVERVYQSKLDVWKAWWSVAARAQG